MIRFQDGREAAFIADARGITTLLEAEAISSRIQNLTRVDGVDESVHGFLFAESPIYICHSSGVIPYFTEINVEGSVTLDSDAPPNRARPEFMRRWVAMKGVF